MTDDEDVSGDTVKGEPRGLKRSLAVLESGNLGPDMSEIAALIKQGTLRLLAVRLYPFEHAVSALADVRKWGHRGKLVLEIGAPWSHCGRNLSFANLGLGMDMNVTEKLAAAAATVAYENIPEVARLAAKRSIIDTIAVMAPAASNDATCRRLAGAMLPAVVTTEACPVIGTSRRASPLVAAFLNGCFVQALDYADTVDEVGHHPSAQCLPAGLAMAQVSSSSGRDLITAIAVGQDIGTRLSLARGPIARQGRLWFPPTVFGGFSATTTVGKLFGLDTARFVAGFGLALHRAHGPTVPLLDPQSELRALRYGMVAQDGIMCATMARENVQVYRDGISELYKSFFGDDYDAGVVVDCLGERYLGTEASIKAWPCCRASHGHIDSLRGLIDREGIAPDMIKEIILEASPFSYANLAQPEADKRRPEKSIQAKNSLYFAIAVAALKEPAIGDFVDDALSKPDVQAISDLVKIRVGENCGLIVPVMTEVRLKDGRAFRETCVDVTGSPQRPLSEERLANKFRDTMGLVTPEIEPARSDRLLDMLLNIEKLHTLDELSALLP
jgi:2-methylcitrate dehydratase PrpD